MHGRGDVGDAQPGATMRTGFRSGCGRVEPGRRLVDRSTRVADPTVLVRSPSRLAELHGNVHLSAALAL